MRTRLTVEFRVSTPLYLGGADPARPEIRSASIKGALRHWYRAVDPGFGKEGGEASLFGGVGKQQGQSPVLLATDWQETPKTLHVTRNQLKCFDQGKGKETKNGVAYLGYTFLLAGNTDRRAIRPGSTFRLICRIPRLKRMEKAWVDGRQQDTQHVPALLSAIWLLGHVGSLGSRARRGFGSLELCSWEWEGEGQESAREQMERLPLLRERRSAEEWLKGFAAAVAQMDQWFGWSKQRPGTHPCLGPALRVVILPAGRPAANQSSYPWAMPLQAVGLEMQRFRSGKEPDRGNVRDHLFGEDRSTVLQVAPERAAFGLPLTFRFSRPGQRTKEIEFSPAGHYDVQGKPASRFPSSLWIRATRIGGNLHGMITRLDGEFPGQKGVVYKESNGYRGRQSELAPITDSLLREFLDRCAAKGNDWSWQGRGGK